MTTRHIHLIGPRACGKTSLGRLLAERLGLQFLDMDKVIEQDIACSIAGYVERHGWEGFRAKETEVLRSICARQPLVNATGGGVVLAEENRELLTSSGTTIYLETGVRTLLDRLGNDPLPGQRPALTDLSAEEEMRQTLRLRGPLYRECADIVLDAADSLEALLQKALDELSTRDKQG